jgi:hypothetical protein
MYSFIHNKSRNRLTVEKTKSLVYIYTNSCVLCEKQGTNPACFYEDNVHSASEDSDPDALGPVPVDEPHRKFDAMKATDEEEDELEVNRVPPTYKPNMELWSEGVDRFEEAQEYYRDGLDEENIDVGDAILGRCGPIKRNPRHEPISPLVQNEGIGVEEAVPPPSETKDVAATDFANDENNDNPPPRHNGVTRAEASSGGFGTVAGRHGKNVEVTEGSLEVPTYDMSVDDAMRFDPSRARIEEDDVPRQTQVSRIPTLQMPFVVVPHGRGSLTQRTGIFFASGSSLPSSKHVRDRSGSTGNTRGEAQNISRTTSGGRPPQAPRPMASGKYALPCCGGRRGKKTVGASSSQPPPRVSCGIGAKDPTTVIEPFLQTYTT